METTVQSTLPNMKIANFQQAWENVLGYLQIDLERAQFETWVKPLQPLQYKDGVFTIGAYNQYTLKWVESRLGSRIQRLLEGLYHEAVTLKFIVGSEFDIELEDSAPQTIPEEEPLPEKKKRTPERDSEKKEGGDPLTRKVALRRAYGSQRSAVIQPERGIFMTNYFLTRWPALIGHSAFLVILAARAMCYWNPMTGELRNEVETEMGELAERAATSVRTVKMVLNDELVKRYFLRYKVRRVMTSNGVRTAGILLQVRMDDPLTPQDQELYDLVEEEQWYSPQFADPEEDD